MDPVQPLRQENAVNQMKMLQARESRNLIGPFRAQSLIHPRKQLQIEGGHPHRVLSLKLPHHFRGLTAPFKPLHTVLNSIEQYPEDEDHPGTPTPNEASRTRSLY